MRALRGQTLVLFGLMLLVLTVMVLGTVGIGVRAKQRVELQMVSDAAAYSEAVVTARTFNMVAVMNRAQVADMVVMAGQQSIISHASQHYEALKNQLSADGGTVCNGHGGLQWPGTTTSGNLDTKWAQADEAAAPGARTIQGAAGAVYPAELALYSKLITQDLVNQKLAKEIFNKAFPGQTEIKVPATGDAKSLNEISGGLSSIPSQSTLESQDQANGGGGNCSGAVCPLTADIRHEVLEAYGSEGWTWVRDRAGGGGETPGMSEFNWNGGSLTYGSVGGFHPGGQISDTAVTSSAHDHPGAITVTCADGTTDSAQTGATYVNATEWQDHGDEHYYNGTDWTGSMIELGLETQPVWQLHSLGPCNVCHGFWPYFLDWNAAIMTAGNEYGQPKLYAVAYRDLTLAPAQPWNLAFTFHFAASGPGTHYNAGTQEEANASGTGLSRQGALSAAIVYYHRPYGAAYPDGWQEPPNFMNPFWRATLVSPEGSNDDDPGATLTTVGLGQQASALNGLESVGFQGVHP